jgi:hypothetical protein
MAADANSRFVVISVGVANGTNDSIHVNPLYFTLIMGDGRTEAIDSTTYSLGGPLQAVNVQPGANTGGALSFLTSNKVAPHYLVYEQMFGPTIKIDLTGIGEPEKP